MVQKFGPLSENSSPLLVFQAGYEAGNHKSIAIGMAMFLCTSRIPCHFELNVVPLDLSLAQ